MMESYNDDNLSDSYNNDNLAKSLNCFTDCETLLGLRPSSQQLSKSSTCFILPQVVSIVEVHEVNTILINYISLLKK